MGLHGILNGEMASRRTNICDCGRWQHDGFIEDSIELIEVTGMNRKRYGRMSTTDTCYHISARDSYTASLDQCYTCIFFYTRQPILLTIIKFDISLSA